MPTSTGSANTLSVAALDWSLAHHIQFGDTDLFPRTFEFEVIAQHWDEIRTQLLATDITTHRWSEPRRMLVPKDHLVFRRGTQLDPVDSLLFAGIVYEIGAKLEARRTPLRDSRVFSSRFQLAADGQLYSQADFWSAFWRKSQEESLQASHVVVCDIADFYRQVDHGVIESQLQLADVPATHSAALLELLRVCAGPSRRGLPVGPHASHLLAESSLIPLDTMLRSFHPRFCRFIDDVHIFCGSEAEAERAVYDVANVLDAGLHLATSGRKTRLVPANEFVSDANTMVVRGDLDEEESNILEIVKEVTDSPYAFASFEDIPDDRRDALDQDVVDDVLAGYLDDPNGPDYPKLRWFLRRLSQVSAPGAVEFVINNLPRLTAAMPDVANYLRTASDEFEGDWGPLGGQLVDALKYPIVERSEYLQLVICSLFSRIADLNHFDKLASFFLHADAAARREIILAARACKAAGWLEAHATTMEGREPWEARAVLLGAELLPKLQRNRLAAEASDERLPLSLSILARRLTGVSGAAEPAKGTPRTTAPVVAFRLELRRGPSFSRAAFQAALAASYDINWQSGTIESADVVEGETALLDRLAADAATGALDGIARQHSVQVLSIRLSSTGEYRYDYITKPKLRQPSTTSITPKNGGTALQRCDVLLVTTTPVERHALLMRLAPVSRSKGIAEFSIGRVTYNVGRLGRYRCACVETKMGSQDRSGSALTVTDAINIMSPKAIIVVGIAFGIDRAKQRLGDVLIAESIMPYELQKVSPETVVQRGTPIQCGVTLADRFRTRIAGWKVRRHGGSPNVHHGMVLSGEKLVNSRGFRDGLVQAFPLAVGGEMEGIGIYAAASRVGTEVILVKGICDWADGEKNDVAQPFASHAAASLVEYVLSKPGALKPLAEEN